MKIDQHTEQNIYSLYYPPSYSVVFRDVEGLLLNKSTQKYEYSHYLLILMEGEGEELHSCSVLQHSPKPLKQPWTKM